MAFILATNREKETHFDYKAEDDTIKQWFLNISLLRTHFTLSLPGGFPRQYPLLPGGSPGPQKPLFWQSFASPILTSRLS